MDKNWGKLVKIQEVTDDGLYEINGDSTYRYTDEMFVEGFVLQDLSKRGLIRGEDINGNQFILLNDKMIYDGFSEYLDSGYTDIKVLKECVFLNDTGWEMGKTIFPNGGHVGVQR